MNIFALACLFSALPIGLTLVLLCGFDLRSGKLSRIAPPVVWILGTFVVWALLGIWILFLCCRPAALPS